MIRAPKSRRNVVEYTFGPNIAGTVGEVRNHVEAALAVEGFGILTTIDVAATFKAKLDIDRDPYLILGACNPTLAHGAISVDANIGALLPCNVVLRQEGSDVAVRFMDPEAVLGITSDSGIEDAAREAKEKLLRVASALSR
jgi:uncharacterized protein (DUF302 family)